MLTIKMLADKMNGFRSGDLVTGLEIVEDLEKIIVLDETNFDAAATLSQVLDQFSAYLKTGIEGDETAFLDGCRRKINQLAEGQPPILTSPASPETAGAVASPVPQPGPLTAEGRKTTVVQVADLEVLTSFILEAQEHLEGIESKILTLENNFATAHVHDIFRSIHTLKGVSSFLNLDEIKSLSHALEYLLDDLRSGAISVDGELIDILLEGRDYLQRMITELGQATEALPKQKGPAQLVVTFYNISPFIVRIQGKRQRANATTVDEAPRSSNFSNESLLTADMLAKFGQEANESIEAVEQCVLSMERSDDKGDYIHEAFRAIHTLKGNSGFFGFADLEKLCMEMEYFLDALRKGEKPINELAINTLLAYLDHLRKRVEGTAPTTEPSTPTEELTTSVEVAQTSTAATPHREEPNRLETDANSKYAIKKKDIRVDTDKLDSLFDLIGELITAEAMVLDNPEIKDLELESFAKASNYLSKITREIQTVTMSIRMIPLDGLFSKMHRLVRDLSKKFNKLIDLEISGQETEMDRNIIEEISDPLIHIIRNAIDHGIEDQARRKANGKSLTGKIFLDAKYEGNEIWISIKDDGQGLNRQRILEVAKSRSMKIDEATMSDGDVYRLIFEPGFSTAKEVSEISGRGVGMDVVRRNIEKLRGQIDILTEAGQGTEFILKIPLTLAIIDGINLRIGEVLYSLPIADVAEFQNFNPDKVTKTDNDHLVLRLREEVIPILRLRDFFNVKSVQRSDSREVVIIAKSQTKKIALIADEIVGYKQIVLKALPEFMGSLKGISGCTILGNGEVSLIIDVNSIFSQYLE